MYRVPPDRAQADHIDGLPLGTRGGIVIHHNFPLDADYDFRVNLLQNIVGYVPGLEWPHVLEISIDGERVFTAPVGGEEDNKLSDTQPGAGERHARPAAADAHPGEGGSARRRRGLHPEELGGVGRAAAAVHPRSRHAEHERDPAHRARADAGPVQGDRSGDTPSRRKIFVCRPPAASRTPSKAEETACATRILTTLARRAYRRPVDTDLDTLVGFYDAGRKKGTFDAGIENALRFILTSPSFLFRGEPDPPTVRLAGTGSSGSPG